jgi:hypothetical protein
MAEEEARMWEYAAAQMRVKEQEVPQLSSTESEQVIINRAQQARKKLKRVADGLFEQFKRRVSAKIFLLGKTALNNNETDLNGEDNWLLGQRDAVPQADFERLGVTLGDIMSFTKGLTPTRRLLLFGVERFCAVNDGYRTLDTTALRLEKGSTNSYVVENLEAFDKALSERTGVSGEGQPLAGVDLILTSKLVFIPIYTTPNSKAALLVWSSASGFHLMGSWARDTAAVFIRDVWIPRFGGRGSELVEHRLLNDDIIRDRVARVVIAAPTFVEVIRLGEILPGDQVSEVCFDVERKKVPSASNHEKCSGFSERTRNDIDARVNRILTLKGLHLGNGVAGEEGWVVNLGNFAEMFKTQIVFEGLMGLKVQYDNGRFRNFTEELEEYEMQQASLKREDPGQMEAEGAVVARHVHLGELAGDWADALAPSDPRRAQFELAAEWHVDRAEELLRTRRGA